MVNSEKISSSPKLWRTSAGGESCCIFRLPQLFVGINGTDYEPRIVSIGPYHHGKEHLEMIQKKKHRFLEFFVSKTQEKGVGLQELVDAVSNLEDEIRDSYSEDIVEFDREKLMHMIVLDGCFILTLFCIVGRLVEYGESDDPIFTTAWIMPSIRRDLLLLENQIPFSVLQVLFKRSKLVTGGEDVDSSRALNKVSFEFFSYGVARPKESWAKRYDLQAKHLLDLFRKSFIPFGSQDTPKGYCPPITGFSTMLAKRISGVKKSSNSHRFLRSILPARMLHSRGIKFRPIKNSDTFLDIRFQKGVVQIPPIATNHFISSILLNCIAFEQFYAYCSSHVTSYAVFMGCLVNNAADAEFLTEKGIIESCLGTAEDASGFFMRMGKNIVSNIEKSCLSEVLEQINEYSSRGRPVHWTRFFWNTFFLCWR